MKTLSIKQPWAWAIVHKGKDIENRQWVTSHRGEFLIHAGSRFDHNAPLSLVRAYSKALLNNEAGTEKGGIIGSAEIVDVVTESESKWFFGPKGFVLKNAKPREFLKVSGKLGFFEVEL